MFFLEESNNFKSFVVCFTILSILIILSFIGYLSYDLHNTKRINEDLKSELYDAKKEVKELRRCKYTDCTKDYVVHN